MHARSILFRDVRRSRSTSSEHIFLSSDKTNTKLTKMSKKENSHENQNWISYPRTGAS
jgi:hypothetical protein